MELLYTRSQAELLRQKIVEEYVIPIVEKVFTKYQRINSCTFAVAQYWDDQAHDEVHDILLFSVLNSFDWEASSQAAWYGKRDEVNLPGFKRDIGYLIGDIYQQVEKERGVVNDYYYREMIPAFAAFCKEGSHQCMSTSEAYTPYAILTRTDNSIAVEIVG
ncbi:hypothetical protein, partial [Hyella patelloides]|uniref:hypothetical protein n=1 Tax=Hyella patelloides TaxID=1982969 RepID=UPI00119EA98D